MKVLEVTHRYPPALGGVEGHVAAIAAGLRVRGFEVEVTTTDVERDRPFRRLVIGRGTEEGTVRRHRAVRVLPAPHGLGIVAPGMALDLLRSRADVVHAHAFGMAPTWLAAATRRLRRVPLVVETHADAGRGTDGWRLYARTVSRGTLGPADRVVVQTRGEGALLSSLGVVPEKLVVIPDGIDLREFSRRPDAVRGSPVTALFVGRLYPAQKGLLPLVRAMAELPARSELHLRLVGEDWGGAEAVRRLALELGVSERIALLGPLARADLIEEYYRADLLVLPSLFEPFGIVLLEAMAAGLPVVATRVGGIPEVVAEGETALLCPPNDPVALAEALLRLEEDPALRRRLGSSGRERSRRFSWESVLPEWVRLFRSVAGHGG